MTADKKLGLDGRLYKHKNHTTVIPLPEWPTLAKWKKERLRYRHHLRLCTGINDQTSAFKAKGHIINSFKHEGIVVENICIETLPGIYVQGNLYHPHGSKKKFPLILHPHGHLENARTTSNDLSSVPHRAMNSALLGFSAFSYSMVGFEDDMKQLEHRTLLTGASKKEANLLGLSMLGIQLNNSIKVLDYLLSRSDIDSDRVGCTGESGGGTQTYFLAAMDERIKVAAPSVMLSNHFQGGCVCEHAPGLRLEYSNLHYAGLIAPRPLLLLGCTGDWTHHMQTRELKSLKKLYQLYGKEDAVDGFYQDEAHNFNRPAREAMYAWMIRWLQHDGKNDKKRITESKKTVPEKSQLLVFNTPVPPYKNAVCNEKQLFDIWRNLHTKPVSKEDIIAALQLELPQKEDILLRGQPPRYKYRKNSDELHALTCGRFSQDNHVVCCFSAPLVNKDNKCILVLRNNKPESITEFVQNAQAFYDKNGLKGTGFRVIIPQLFGQRSSNELTAFKSRADSYLSSSYNKTEHQHQLDDILTIICMAQYELNIKPESITIAADKGMGLLAFIAWAYLCSLGKIDSLIADFDGVDLQDPVSWAEYAYIPLLLGSGGINSLSSLCNAGKGSISGVRKKDRSLLPKGLSLQKASKTICEILHEKVNL